MLLLYDAITSVYTHECLITYSCMTCLNIPIMLGHVTTRNKHSFADSYIIDHVFVHVCISYALHILVYTQW